MTTPNNASQVRVGVRIRPLSAKETNEGGKGVVDGNAFDRTVSLSKRKFTYDSVFHPNVNQQDLYANVAPPLLHSFLNGFNATILAYGQTGSGKTFTMGSEAGGNFEENLQNGQLSEDVGLIPRFMSDMFASLFQRREASEKALLQSRDDDNNISEQPISLVDFKVSASFLEVYGEDIFDLLDDSEISLKMREDSNKEVIVVGLKCAPIKNASEAMNILNTGTMNRTTAATLMNHTSSRSHAVFTVNLLQTTRSSDGLNISTTSRFTFVDLAGSERMKKTGAEGARAKEGIKINEGLLALGNVINALADDARLEKGDKVHVPYRQSKLTRLLQDALGGNSQTFFLACVSPSDTNASETLSTLHYANRARNIKNAPTRNVDATAEELRRLRTLTSLLKCELIKERFDGGSSTRATDPEVEMANESVNPQDIGVVNEDLLGRDDVIAYMKQIDDKASELNGSTPNMAMSFPAQTPAFTADRPMPQSFLGTPTRQVTSMPNSSNVDFGTDDDEIDDSDMSINPDEDIQIIDELLEEHQHEEQLNKIEGDIEEQEDRLLQLKEHIKVYADMKEKYKVLSNEVEKLESEKQALVEKLEKAEGGEGCSLSIKTKLEQVKASLVRARQDVRKQQQKCREVETEAQRCKGLERRIEEMKSTKANLIRKQKDDAKRQKDFTKTKAREIQDLRRKERSAQKKVLKLEAECQRHKTSVERSKTRYDKLSNKLKQTESNLKQAIATKRSSSSVNGSRHDSEADTGQFAPASGKINSIKYVLDKTVKDKVALFQNRKIYKSKVGQREDLLQAMGTEVKLLNELKRQCESDPQLSNEFLAEVKDHEDNVQDFLIEVELVENNLEELIAKYPSIEDKNKEDETRKNVFDEHEPALKMISKLKGPLLRSLFLDFLGSCLASELDRQGLKDALVKKDFTLSTLEDEVASQKEKISILSQSLEKHAKSEEQLNATKDEYLLELKITKEALSVSEENKKKSDGRSAEAIAHSTEQQSSIHAQELENLRVELQSLASSDLQRVQEESKQRHQVENQRITEEMEQSHAAETEKVKLDILAQADCSRSEQLAQLAASHREETERIRSEMETAVSQAISQTTEQLSANHAREIENLRTDLQMSTSSELDRVKTESEQHHQAEALRITAELKESHAAEVDKVKADMLASASRSHPEQLEQLAASNAEQIACVRYEMEASASHALSLNTERLSTSHAQEIESLRNEMQSMIETSTSQMLTHEKQIESLEEKFAYDRDSLLSDLDGGKEALSVSEENCKKLKGQVAEQLSQQKQMESIESQINNSASNKDTLLRELEKTALLKELKETKEKHNSQMEQLDSVKKQLLSNLVEKDKLLREIEDVKVVEMKRDEALTDNRRDANTPQAPDEKKPNAAVIDTSGFETLASSELVETPSSTHSSSSAVLSSFSKYDSLKQRYLKKVRASPSNR